eukprot:m.1607992 g.1607992  ORF g.1607992 m.1607992 type:complete len:118 (-) comp25363_c0_seq7:2534-2887(-)
MSATCALCVCLHVGSTGMSKVIAIMGDRIVSASTVGLYCRQLAIHANLAALVHRKFGGNWLERLKTLKQIHKKFIPPTTADETATNAKTSETGKPDVVGLKNTPSTEVSASDFTTFV